jgi:hypothetical protein
MDEETNENSRYSSTRRNSEMNKKADGSNSYIQEHGEDGVHRG